MEALVSTSYWAGKRVFVTGHTGFKGTWLLAMMRVLGAKVAGYALDPPTAPSMFDQIAGSELCQDIRGDIRDLSRLQRAMSDFAPEFIFHLAAQPIVLAAREHGVDTVDTNVRGTACVLEAARRVGSLRSIVSVTTDKVYRNVEWCWPYREADALGGHEPYGASKACAEIVTEAWAHSFLEPAGVAVASARAGNVIGGGDWAPARLVPDIVRAWQASRALTIRSPQSIRPWQHVLEPLAGYVALAAALAEKPSGLPRSFNFGPREEDAQPVARICELANCALDGGLEVIVAEATTGYESRMLRLDSSLAQSDLAWRPRLDLESAIKWTIDWYRGVHRGADARALTIEQLERYQSLG